MAKTRTHKNEPEVIQFKIHPRVFSALGSDLITSDIVAMLELVKNSYDAFAHNVTIGFLKKGKNECIEIKDDGFGMSLDTIKNVWTTIATPYKEINRIVKQNGLERRVVGEKGLGRLSAARLGEKLEVITKSRGEKCWKLEVDWKIISSASNINDCGIRISEFVDDVPFKKTGTLLRIFGLKEVWDEQKKDELEENLTRLVSPFQEIKDFSITVIRSDQVKPSQKIEAPIFLRNPKYKIAGVVGDDGGIKATYEYKAISNNRKRKKEVVQAWKDIYARIDKYSKKTMKKFKLSPTSAKCGGFSFEIRAWDIAPDDTQEIIKKYKLIKSNVRKAISVHKGISVYRDKFLVLPKSDTARDWLGLDLRRVSRVGSRMSTSQIVGYVSINGDENSKIRDTSDRERLVSCREVAEFEEIIIEIVSILEQERSEDRITSEPFQPMRDLLGALSADDLITEVASLVENDAKASEVLPLIKEYNGAINKVRGQIKERFIYYSRMATVGTIASMLVHEIRNRTMAIGDFLSEIKQKYLTEFGSHAKKMFGFADESIEFMEKLADSFLPLANISYKRGKRNSVLEERVKTCASFNRAGIKAKKIQISLPTTRNVVAVDPGELDTIFLNLINNSIYWVSQRKDKREIDIQVNEMGNKNRLQISVSDSGPGVEEEDLEKIFLPGITRKPNGIGMGLTIAAEIVQGYGGEMSLKYPGDKGGATFIFDIPVEEK